MSASDLRLTELKKKWLRDRLGFYCALTKNQKMRFKIHTNETIFVENGDILAWFHTSADGYLTRRPIRELSFEALFEHITSNYMDETKTRLYTQSYVNSRLWRPNEWMTEINSLKTDQENGVIIQLFHRPAEDIRYICAYSKHSTPCISNIGKLRFSDLLQRKESWFTEPCSNRGQPYAETVEKTIRRTVDSIYYYIDKWNGNVISGCAMEFYINIHGSLIFLSLQALSWSVSPQQIYALINQKIGYGHNDLSNGAASLQQSSQKKPSRPISAPTFRNRQTVPSSPATPHTRMTETPRPPSQETTNRPQSARIPSPRAMRRSLSRSSSGSSAGFISQKSNIVGILKDQLDSTKQEVLELSSIYQIQRTCIQQHTQEIKKSNKAIEEQEAFIEIYRNELMEKAGDAQRLAQRVEFISELKDQLETDQAVQKSKFHELMSQKSGMMSKITNEHRKTVKHLEILTGELNRVDQSMNVDLKEREKLLRQIMKLETRVIMLQKKREHTLSSLKIEQASVEKLQRQYRLTLSRLQSRSSDDDRLTADIDKVEIVGINIDDLLEPFTHQEQLDMSLSIQDHFHRFKDALNRTFRYYSMYGSSEIKVMEDRDLRLNLTQFNRFVKDCNIFGGDMSAGSVDRCFIKTCRGADYAKEYMRTFQITARLLTYDQFLESIVRLSVLRYPETRNVSESLNLILNTKVIPYAKRIRKDLVELEIESKGIKEIFDENEAVLIKLFNDYCRQLTRPRRRSASYGLDSLNISSSQSQQSLDHNTSTSSAASVQKDALLSLRQFLKLMIDFGMIDKGLSLPHAIFCYIHAHAKVPEITTGEYDISDRGITYNEFKEALLRAANITHRTYDGPSLMLRAFFKDFLSQDNLDGEAHDAAQLSSALSAAKIQEFERLKLLLSSMEKDSNANEDTDGSEDGDEEDNFDSDDETGRHFGQSRRVISSPSAGVSAAQFARRKSTW